MHNFGVCGVCFFFVHTCLVLFGSMERTRTSMLTRDFYIRRGFRIYPLCWLSIVLVLSTVQTDIPHEDLVRMGWRGIAANFALVQNITRSGDVLGPLWSLPWEVQMYLVLPALFLFLKRRSKPVLVAVAIWFGITILAIVSEMWRVPAFLHAAIYPPMFLGGIVAYHVTAKTQPRIPSFLWPVFVPVLIIVRCLLLHGDNKENPYNVAVNATVCLLLGFAIPQFKSIGNRPLRHAAQRIAQYSYGIYLFHVPALAFIFIYLAGFPIAFKLLALVVLTGAASVASYHLLEHPLIRYGKQLAGRFETPVQPVTAD